MARSEGFVMPLILIENSKDEVPTPVKPANSTAMVPFTLLGLTDRVAELCFSPFEVISQVSVVMSTILEVYSLGNSINIRGSVGVLPLELGNAPDDCTLNIYCTLVASTPRSETHMDVIVVVPGIYVSRPPATLSNGVAVPVFFN